MTDPFSPVVLSPVAAATQRLADAISLAVPDMPVRTKVVGPVSPPAVVIGPPQLMWQGYTQQGRPTSGQWQVYVVAAMNAYAVDTLLSLVATISSAIELHTPAVVLGSEPGVYPSSGPSSGPTIQAGWPAYRITVAMESFI